MGSLSVPWKQLLLTALETNAHLKYSSFFQLVISLSATVRPNGKPANRTVVFRGFQEGSDKIQINTDSRSHKIEDIKHCPFGEICWYFTDSWEQFRIEGRIDIIDGLNSELEKLQNYHAKRLKRPSHLSLGETRPVSHLYSLSFLLQYCGNFSPAQRMHAFASVISNCFFFLVGWGCRGERERETY
ncbi:pyridoxine/pyridoxamine 5'-phosphate oxidase 2 isoform X6 [Amborella trichopoda]|uniref:pyridoxine/pyridoxamine 5'-phosphate oxidase 2 isoform X6 n=1 Tax=Amborella trichopoda TaxID=13333 RepID=UPI0009C051A8|nr:pyridoxine/pyridoxamine 5'-phosphate oxidase 2 isoform X6 [Amborella trichopoda]XP_020531498.1 pyridoxine/pyridoxamine 5'-phosphate oxidase 2 isoform X6 [Amborella trichopoda]|eukprot:XP_020531497.1 pyridoxine/pyridoxamine 5'-phosphate oxidase 2 isoform X6 [Amborella trichopoda]